MRRYLDKIRTASPHKIKRCGFTLVELLISISIFMTVSVLAAGMYVDLMREQKRAEGQNLVYAEARFLMMRLAQEIRANAIDYDEYYNQNVVANTGAVPEGGPGFGSPNYGQNYGRYYSSFFNPGKDNKLGFLCNDGQTRNSRGCIPLRKTIDRNTGQNPFSGKYRNASADKENAFCGNVSYQSLPAGPRPAQNGDCGPDGNPNETAARAQSELYLISSDGTQKTIFAREKIGNLNGTPLWALSILRMKGADIDRDKIPDSFVCADEFQCVGVPDVSGAGNGAARDICGRDAFGDLPRSRAEELENGNDLLCDRVDRAFGKDFVPVTPLNVNIKDIRFVVSPDEDPRYAFAENAAQEQPNVTIILTMEPNVAKIGLNAGFEPITLTETVYSGVLTPVPAPLLAQ